ncbi:hypothetical protein E2320_016131, partial [Naja naja]
MSEKPYPNVPNGTNFLIGAKNPLWGQDGVILFGFLLYLILLICAGRGLIVFLLILPCERTRARNDPAWKHVDLVCNTIYLFIFENQALFFFTEVCLSLLYCLAKNALSFAHSYIAFLQEEAFKSSLCHLNGDLR